MNHLDNDIKRLLQELSLTTWQKNVVIEMYREIERLRKLSEEQ